MDLINELKEIKDDVPVEKLIGNLEEEQVKIGMKIHMLKVINLSKVMTQLIQSDISKDKILGMDLAYHQDGDKYRFSIHLFDHNEKRLKIDPQFRENSKALVELLKKNGKINPDYVSESFWKDKKGKVFFNKEIDKQIFDLFLNEEFKKTLDYSQLSIRLEEKEGNPKKPKI